MYENILKINIIRVLFFRSYFQLFTLSFMANAATKGCSFPSGLGHQFTHMFFDVISNFLSRQIIRIATKRIFNFFGNQFQTR